MYLLSPEIKNYLPKEKSFGMDMLIKRLLKLKKKICVFPIKEDEWRDTGNWDDYFKLGTNSFPYSKSLGYPDFSSVGAVVSEDLYGTGTLIAPNVVVTAAHVLRNTLFDPTPTPSSWKFILNSDYENIDAVCGFRKNRKDKFLRSLYSKIANFFIRKLLKSNIKDLGCSLKLFRKNLIEEIRFSGDMHRMLSVLFEYRGHRIIQIPVVHKERKFGETKYGLNRLIPVFVDSFLIYLSEGFTLTPRYSLSKLAFYSFMASFLLISYSAFQKFAYEIFVHRNPIFLIGLTFLFISIQFYILPY